MGRFSNDADVWISEDGDTWIRIDTVLGSYAYNKTKHDELMNEPIKITMSDTPDGVKYSAFGGYITPPVKLPGWMVAQGGYLGSQASPQRQRLQEREH